MCMKRVERSSGATKCFMCNEDDPYIKPGDMAAHNRDYHDGSKIVDSVKRQQERWDRYIFIERLAVDMQRQLIFQ